MTRHSRPFQPLFRHTCCVCRKTYVAVRRHKVTCGARCRQKLSRGAPRLEVPEPRWLGTWKQGQRVYGPHG